jgi:ATP-dependent protease ClpP protease subunit
VGVLSVCGHRAAMPSTRFSLREPSTQMEARAREVAQWAQLRADEWERFTSRVAAAAGRPGAAVVEAFAAGLFMGAEEALDYGLIDEICRPEAEIRRIPGPPIGFRPRR